MKRIIFTLAIFTLATFSSFSQKVNLESAITFYRNGDELSMKDAKKYIDLATANEETNLKPKMWYYRGLIYNKIDGDEKESVRKIDTNAAEKALEAFLRCVELDKKEEFRDIIDLPQDDPNATTCLLTYATFRAYNSAVEKLNRKDYAGTLRIYDLILKVYKYDTRGELAKNNLSKNALTLLSAQINNMANNTARSKELLNSLVDGGYSDKNVYTSLYNLYMKEKDTAGAISILDKASRIFTEDPLFSEIEMQLYLASGNNAVFIEKVSKKIEKNPDNGKYYYYRGLVYEDIRNELSNKKAPAASIDSMNKLIEPDYKKAVELNENDTFSQYNLGAFYYNQCVPIINKIGKLDDKKPDYKTKLDQLETEKKNLLAKAQIHLEKAYQLKDDDKQIVIALQHLYEQLKMNDKAKEMETKAKSL